MKYCVECGHKNPEDNRFCENCGVPLQAKAGSTRSPRKKRSGCWKYLFGIIVVIAIALWGIGSFIGDTDGDEGTLCEVSLEEEDLVSDFQMSDIDWLIDFALNCELLDQEYIKVLSNGFHDGELLCGIGEYSDVTEYDEVMLDLMSKYDNYKDAFLRLEKLDLFHTDDGGLLSVSGIPGRQMLAATWMIAAATGSGSASSWGKEKIEWLGAQITGAQKDHDEMLAIMRQMGAFHDSKMQQAIFECVNNTGGHKDAHSFFIALNNGGMPHLGANHLSQIRQKLEWVDGDTHAKWVKAEESLKCHKTFAEHWCDRGMELVDKGVDLELKVLDKLIGGGVSTVQKWEKYAQNVKKLKEAMFDGKTEHITESDIRTAMRKNGIEKMRKLMPKTGNDAADKVIKYICDKLQEEALKEEPTGKLAEEKDLTLIDLLNGTGDMSKALIVTGEDGKVHIVIPDGKGDGRTITMPGKKRVSVINKDGKRSKTTKVKAKKGKLSVGKKVKKDNIDNKDNNEKATEPQGISGEDVEKQAAPPKGSYWKLEKRYIHAENNGEYFPNVKMTVTPGRFHMSAKCPYDTYPGPYEYYQHDNCKGEFKEYTITYTGIKLYYAADAAVVLTYKTSTSASKFTDAISYHLSIVGGISRPNQNVLVRLKNAEGRDYISAHAKNLNEYGMTEFTDVTEIVNGQMPKGSREGDVMDITIIGSHGNGEDALSVVYHYVWVEGVDEERETKKQAEERYNGNGIQERKPEFIEGPVTLGITGDKENITIPK